MCIFLHETGHLCVAKLCHCKVEKFSIGFGKKIIGKQFGSTYYQIAILPLGGYCKLKDETTLSKSKYSFTNLKYRYKLAIASAGCLVNIVTGIIAIILGSQFLIESLFYFGLISITLGLTNLLPIPPTDGFYILFMPIFIQIFGKKIGLKKFKTICKIGFKILNILNIISLIFFIYIYGKTL